MAKFCPICKAACSNQCALYSESTQGCAIMKIAEELVSVEESIGNISQNDSK